MTCLRKVSGFFDKSSRGFAAWWNGFFSCLVWGCRSCAPLVISTMWGPNRPVYSWPSPLVAPSPFGLQCPLAPVWLPCAILRECGGPLIGSLVAEVVLSLSPCPSLPLSLALYIRWTLFPPFGFCYFCFCICGLGPSVLSLSLSLSLAVSLSLSVSVLWAGFLGVCMGFRWVPFLLSLMVWVLS